MLPTLYAGKCLHVNHLQLFEMIERVTATKVSFAINKMYFIFALFSRYLTHLIFIYLYILS